MVSGRPPPPDGYDVSGVLAEGGSAVVYRARSAVHGDVALKVWRRPPADATERARIDRECALHRFLSPDAAPHPHIVAFVAASGADATYPWIATRPGGDDLRRLVGSRAPTYDEAHRIALDLLDGIGALHDRGIVHGDITPRNVVVYNGRGALCDLGLAFDSASPGAATPWGTPEFMAPELLDGCGTPDARSDVYAAAATIATILPRDDTPARVEHLVETKARSVRPGDRPRDARHFAALISSGSRPRPAARSRTRWVAAAALLGAVVLLWGGWWVWAQKRPAIEHPTGGPVVSPVEARGRLDSGDTVWIVTRMAGAGAELVVTPAVRVSNRTWETHFDLGQGPCDEGREFTITAVAEHPGGPLSITAEAAGADGLYTAPLERIPPEAVVIGDVTVTLGLHQGFNRCPGVVHEVDPVPVPESEVPQ